MTLAYAADRVAPARRAAAVGAAMFVASMAAAAAAGGSLLPAVLVVTLLAAVGLLVAPRAGVVALLVVTVMVLPQRFLPLEMAGFRTDLPELLMIGLFGTWLVLAVVTSGPQVAERRRLSPSPFTGPLLLLAAAAAVGSVVGVVGGATRSDILGTLKTYGFWLLPLPLAWFVFSRSDLEWLERWLFRLATTGGIITLAMAATGVATAADGGGTVVTLQTAAEAQRIRPPVQQLLFLTTLLMVHRMSQRGARPVWVAQLALFLVVQTLSFNRSTWAALALCVGALVVLRPGTRVPLEMLRVGVVLFAAGGSAYALSAMGALGPTAEAIAVRASSLAQPEVLGERSLSDRVNENEAALRTLRERPLTGVGLGQPYGARRGLWSAAAGRVVYFDRLFIHNSFLGAWLHLGLVGVAAFAWLAVAIARRTWQAVRGLKAPDGGRALAAALGVFGMGLQAAVQTKLYHRPTIVVVALALTFLSVASRPDAVAT